MALKKKTVKGWAVIERESNDLIAGMSFFGHPVKYVRPFDIFFHRVESFWIGEDLWVGFKCSGCGEINGAQKSVL